MERSAGVPQAAARIARWAHPRTAPFFSPPQRSRAGVRRPIVSRIKSPRPGPLPARAGRGRRDSARGMLPKWNGARVSHPQPPELPDGRTHALPRFSPSPPQRSRAGVRRPIVSRIKSPRPGPLPARAGRGRRDGARGVLPKWNGARVFHPQPPGLPDGRTHALPRFSPSPPQRSRAGVRRPIVSRIKSPRPGPLPAQAGRGSRKCAFEAGRLDFIARQLPV